MADIREIRDRSDIIALINAFYTKVLQDEQIGHFFTKVVQMDWNKHFPIMYDFWESTLLGTGTYAGNPMTKHIELNQKSIIQKEHFDRWLFLWEETIHENFQGDLAEQAVTRARNIAGLMHHKIQSSVPRSTKE